ncbi:MAG: response regulator [Methanotrichaceae archaeon]
MKSDPKHELRERAEDLLKKECNQTVSSGTEDAQALVHELQVHQIELEMQNEELKRAKLEAEVALTKYSDLYDFAPFGLFTLDKHGVIREVNLAGAELLGTERSCLLNKRFELYVTLRDRSTLDAFCHEVYFTEVKQKCEICLLKSTGEKINAYVEGTFIEKPDLEYRLAIIDITDRKKVEEALAKAKNELEVRVLERTRDLESANRALQDSEERFRVTLKNSPIMVFNQDKELRYTWIYNFPAGVGPDKILGRTDYELFRFSEAERLTEIKRRVLETGVGAREEADVTYNENTITQDITIEPLYDSKGKIVGITCAAVDKTLYKQAEEQLRKAKEAAEAAARVKAEFMANMSHEIRTPLNAIIGMADLLGSEDLEPQLKENFELIRINGEALLAIINDILDFSKIESDKVVLEKRSFNLRSNVEEALDLVSVKAAEKGLNLAYMIDRGVPETIIGDYGRLRQVLGNLLSNAVKFTDKGEIKLSVSLSEDGGKTVHFAVEDTGIGISEDHMSLLFQPFSQMEPSTSRLYGGTGLGLAVSKKLVDLMGGRIWAESRPGEGSTFHFTIPLEEVHVEAKSHLTEPQPQLIGRSILIVDDNKSNRRILGGYAYSWGMHPTVIASPDDALQRIERGDEFDIAILDINRQNMDSVRLAENIRKYNKVMPLVILTSIGQHLPSDHAYLTKPIKPSQLCKILIEILSRSRVRDAKNEIQKERKVQSKPLKILLAEDNESSQKVAIQMLQRLGYKADVVASGLEAVSAIERRPYDVVLMDIKMSGMDGLEAARIITQRWPPENRPKIIAMTAYALEGDQEKCLRAGMDGYISKPVKIGDLKDMLEGISPRSDDS